MAEALNLADDRRPAEREAALRMLDGLELREPFPGAARVGISGAPGAGKSTLLDAFVRHLRARDEKVAIVAVDPSSRVSGGALLGDRFRMRSRASDPGVFVRSMAARDRLGGLADASRAGVLILAAAFDHVFVETVGVGQTESDVAALVDTFVYVANPGAGDMLQFMKAGVLELPDVFLVNKADLGEVAELTAAELASGLDLGQRCEAGWTAPVLKVSARSGSGIEEALAALDAHRAHLLETGSLRERRARGRERWILDTLERRYGSVGLDRLGGPDAVRKRVRQSPESSSFALLERLAGELG